jgi:hypothetical protein
MNASGAAHPFNIDPWITWFIVLWLLGVFGSAGEWLRRLHKRQRKALERRRAYRLELARARAGLPYREAQVPAAGSQPDLALPAAVIPAPPGVARTVPGPCRHEKIVPVIGADGELKRWVCANYPRCDAEFDKSVALYEPDEEGTS